MTSAAIANTAAPKGRPASWCSAGSSAAIVTATGAENVPMRKMGLQCIYTDRDGMCGCRVPRRHMANRDFRRGLDRIHRYGDDNRRRDEQYREQKILHWFDLLLGRFIYV